MIITTYQSGIFQLKSEQIIHASLGEVWQYFSMPKNLDNLTPEDMAFQITSDVSSTMYEGQIITYIIEILPGIKQSWVTEITHVQDQEFFVDEQRFGPYVMWHHEHHFKALDTGQVYMQDIVSYKLPLGFLGKMVAGSLIKKRVEKIFKYREQQIDKIFK